jgi:hypothetical protein
MAGNAFKGLSLIECKWSKEKEKERKSEKSKIVLMLLCCMQSNWILDHTHKNHSLYLLFFLSFFLSFFLFLYLKYKHIEKERKEIRYWPFFWKDCANNAEALKMPGQTPMLHKQNHFCTFKQKQTILFCLPLIKLCLKSPSHEQFCVITYLYFWYLMKPR